MSNFEFATRYSPFDQKTRVDFFVVLITTGACVAVNTAAGFVIGWLVAALLVRGVFRVNPPPQTNGGA